MSDLLVEDFEARALGALSGFNNGGSEVKSGTNGPASPVGGTKALFCASDGDYCTWSGGGSLGDQTFYHEQKYVSTSSMMLLLRANTSGSAAYWGLYEASGGNLRPRIRVQNSGLITSAEGSYNVAVSAGDTIAMYGEAKGSALAVRIWNKTTGGTYATGSEITLTNSLHASGMVGVKKTGVFEWTASDNWTVTDGASGVTANGVTLTATASLIAGSASGTGSATANGQTLTATASLIAGSASGVVNGTLNFQAAGMEFGRRTGLDIDTFALDNGASYRYSIHADGLTLGAALHNSSAQNLDSAGKLANYVGSAVAPGTTYRVVAIRQADGEAAIFRVTAS